MPAKKKTAAPAAPKAAKPKKPTAVAAAAPVAPAVPAAALALMPFEVEVSRELRLERTVRERCTVHQNVTVLVLADTIEMANTLASEVASGMLDSSESAWLHNFESGDEEWEQDYSHGEAVVYVRNYGKVDVCEPFPLELSEKTRATIEEADDDCVLVVQHDTAAGVQLCTTDSREIQGLLVDLYAKLDVLYGEAEAM